MGVLVSTVLIEEGDDSSRWARRSRPVRGPYCEVGDSEMTLDVAGTSRPRCRRPVRWSFAAALVARNGRVLARVYARDVDLPRAHARSRCSTQIPAPFVRARRGSCRDGPWCGICAKCSAHRAFRHARALVAFANARARASSQLCGIADSFISAAGAARPVIPDASMRRFDRPGPEVPRCVENQDQRTRTWSAARRRGMAPSGASRRRVGAIAGACTELDTYTARTPTFLRSSLHATSWFKLGRSRRRRLA